MASFLLRSGIVVALTCSLATEPAPSARQSEAAVKALDARIEDLRRDFTTLFARYHAAVQEAAALNTARGQLAAAKP